MSHVVDVYMEGQLGGLDIVYLYIQYMTAEHLIPNRPTRERWVCNFNGDRGTPSPHARLYSML